MLTAQGSERWHNLLEEAAVHGTFKVQTHFKWLGPDQVERDEGVWLFSAADQRLELERYPFKQLDLQERISIVDKAAQYSSNLFRNTISVIQSDTSTSGAKVDVETWKQALQMIDLDTSYQGTVFIGPDTLALRHKSSVLTIETIPFNLLHRDCRILVVQHAMRLLDQRFKKARQILDDWDTLVKKGRETYG